MSGEEREERRADRDARREVRRAEREVRRAERRRIRAEMHAHLGDVLRERIRAEVHEGLHGKKWYFGFGDMGAGMQGERAEASEIVERKFGVAGVPRLRVSNVSGETEITVGAANEVFVRARKRVHGWSEDRARRLLENVEIRMEQDGDEIVVEPRLFQQERGWLELFRGGRVAVDLDVRVPRETHVEASTVSGELSVTGTRGQHELKSVSGEVSIDDVQGPMQLRTVSGDVSGTRYAGRVEANSVSGEIAFDRSRVRTPDIVTVSGDVGIHAASIGEDQGEGRVKTVSGDVVLVIDDADAEIDHKTVSGDVIVEVPARIDKTSRRDRHIVIGRGGGAQFRVKTVSGDLKIGRAPGEAVAAEGAAGEAMPMGAPEPPPPPQPSAIAREILERVARGELAVEDAAAQLDAARGR
ncbi:MAG: DUF4097 family beta strand repeat protein [Chloroflexi bacterium]|nr:DUF4097 family beta strand repeat protein [Chloroflexota bacterium]